jgi:4-amino-4-deoxy-L-arabinose transferase-like glycosyltransferase
MNRQPQVTAAGPQPPWGWLAGLSSTRHPLLLLLLLSVGIKTALLMTARVINPDGVLYFAAANEILLGHLAESLTYYVMPAYPMLLALARSIVPDWVLAARIVSILAVVLALLPVYHGTKMVFGKRAAFWSGFLFAVWPMANDLALDSIRGPVYLLFFLAFICCSIRSIDDGPGRFSALAMGSALAAILLRIEGIVLIPLFLGTFVFLAVKNRRARGALLAWFCLWGALFLAAGALLVFMSGVHNPLGFNRIGQVWMQIRDIASLKFLDHYFDIYRWLAHQESVGPFSEGGQNLLAIVRHYMPVIYGLGALETLVKVVFPPFLVPILLGFTASRPGTGYLKLVLFTYLLMLLYIHISTDMVTKRLFVAPAALLLVWAGPGMQRLAAIPARTRIQRIALLILIVLIVASPFYRIIDENSDNDTTIKMAGSWLKHEIAAGKVSPEGILSGDARIDFYARGIAGFREYWQDSIVVHGLLANGNLQGLEQLATEKKKMFVALRYPKGKGTPPVFKRYRLLKTIRGSSRVLYVFKSETGF